MDEYYWRSVTTGEIRGNHAVRFKGFAGGVWTNVSNSGAAPSPRYLADFVYDAKDGYDLLFGGERLTAPYALNDTWTWSGGVWTNITPHRSPSARVAGMLAYDTKDGYAVLFGGFGQGRDLNDTWEFVGGTWTNVTTPNSPVPLNSASLAFDAKNDYVLLFGGNSQRGYEIDTWGFAGGKWTELVLVRNWLG